ncbi:alpha/beta fold hydrolase [Bradyrhizobium liaoningense]|uniref:alpha/beta fold hydrolase n=1 Tax=Bradyrhizobium liaoningense TaxID=43992 RepID=UPI001BAD6657|nr:alpha/beta hydrolase [Bradyrhizobium liaoningense]MBR1167512.1 alpha/beta hydrolase [Bradyrhizobium liaoningense]
MATGSRKIDSHRRHLIGIAAVTTAATELGILSPLVGLTSSAPGYAQVPSDQERKVDIGFLEIDNVITLRRMLVRHPSPKGTALFLHGFPETLYAWKDISLALADDYEVHAFDWPGYGLSSRPDVSRFSYAPKDYARVLDDYIAKAGIDKSKLTIYATDIGALPVLLLALKKPDLAKSIIVGDFAPFDRPAYMYESLQKLKAGPSMEQARAILNKNRDEILQNTFTRGLPEEAKFEISREFKDDMAIGWSQGAITTADAFSHYYSHFTRDQEYFESQVDLLKIPVKVVWGEKDLYIKKEMGIEFAARINAEFTLLTGIGHYFHLQDPKQVIEEIRASFR